jgi:molecular chaperone DnaK
VAKDFQMQRHPVGLDLGTTESVLAFVDDSGKAQTWKPDGGSALHASAVLVDSRVHVGDQAIKFAGRNNSLIEGFKRDMGKSHCQATIKGTRIPPEILSGFVLEHLKTRAEKDLGPIKDVVISVPAYFDAKRRMATQQAGLLAGLNVVAIINEPTAASIGYSYHMGYFEHGSEKPSQNLLVYDFGGGTFDVNLLCYADDRFKTLATDGDVRLGGIDLDEQLAEYLAGKFYEQTGADPRGSSDAFKSFVAVANEIKHGLTQSDEYVANLVYAGEQTTELILREEFNGIIEPYIERTIATCEDLLYAADQKNWSDIDTILLVGGSSQIPFITEKLKSLTGLTPISIGNPQELVAEGCALYAANLSDGHEVNFDITNVNSHSLGISGRDVETGKPINRILVPRNTTLPITVKKKFVTFKKDQKSVKLILLEGESENPELCYEVGKFRVELGPGVEKGELIEVFCNYNDDGTIHVTATLVNDDGTSASLEISRNLDSLESLDVWKKRLTSIGDSTSSNESMFGEPHYSNEDFVAAMKDLVELDDIFFTIGKRARYTTMPDPLVEQQKFIGTLEHQVRQIEPLVEQLGMEVASVNNNKERQKLRASINILKSLENQHRSAYKQAVISLGRSCHKEGMLLDAVETQPERLAYLQSAVKEIWT